jgi:hypothetical protein
MSVHVPEEGNPVNKTLPVEIVHVGGVIVPTVGGAGIGGCTFIKTLPDGKDVHPVELVTVKVYVPEGSVERVVAVPEPETSTPPGLLVSVQVPVAGNPLKTAFPVDISHVG